MSDEIHRRDGFSTRAVHSGASHNTGDPTGITIPLSSSWVLPQSGDGGLDEDYGRVGTSLTSRLEQQCRTLEEADHAIVFGSGIGALNAVVGLLKCGDTIVAEQNTYGCTMRLLKVWERFGIDTHYVDLTTDAGIATIVSVAPAMVMIESPTNPLLKILDIKRIAAAATAVNATLIVDNSFANAYNQQPLSLGATLSVTSLTKYHNGHSTGMVGVVCTNDQQKSEQLYFQRKALGLQPCALECTMTVQGIQTLELRMERVGTNALAFASFLEQHPKVQQVRYPFLASHPQHDLARQQMKSGSGMLTADFNLKPNQLDAFIDSLSAYFARSHSLGSVKSQVSIPARMSHASVPREQRLQAGITDCLVRFSIGIENVEDLIASVEEAFRKVKE